MEKHKEEPKRIATEIEQAASRLQAMACERSEEEKPPRSKSLSEVEIGTVLGKRGYPLRHREHLSMMQGPSLEKARVLLPRITSGDCLLLLVGDRGPGKTQMATWWAAERLRNGQACGWYRKTVDLISEIKQTWGDGGKAWGTEADILRKYRSTQFLVLDEFHERGESDWEGRTLVNILDHRYDAMLATVLISNIVPAQVKFQLNPSIVSRAEETGGLIACAWPSYRLTSQKAAA